MFFSAVSSWFSLVLNPTGSIGGVGRNFESACEEFADNEGSMLS